MEKRTLYAAVFVVLLGLGAYAAMRAPGKGEHTGPAPRAFAAIKASELTRIEITTQKDEKTTLEKKGDAWRVTAPSDWPADPQATKALTDAIEKLSFGDIVTENAAKHGDLGVLDKGSVHLKLVTATQSPEFFLGQTVGGFTMLRLAGKNEVWQAAGLVTYQANKTPKDWRDHAVVQLSAPDIDKLSVEVPGASRLTLERVADAPQAGAGKDAKKSLPVWKITEATGDAPKPDEVFDASQASTALQTLQAMRASDFADGKSAEEAGLAPPALTLTASGKGKTQTLEIGAMNGDDVYVRKAGEPTIFVVKKYMVERAAARPIDYRDKILMRYKADEIAKLSITQGKDTLALVEKSGAWTASNAKPTDKIDAGKAKTLVGGVENLSGGSFLTDKTVKTELEKPRAIIGVELKAGTKATLKIGALTKDNAEYYVQREGSKDVLLAKKFAIDRLLKKLSDLAPSLAPPPGGHGMPPGMMPPGMGQ